MAKTENKQDKKTPKKSAAAESKPREKKPGDSHWDEIGGLALCAVGVILGVITYVPSDALFGRLVPMLFGMVGVLAYALPVVLIALGIVVIAIPRRQLGRGIVTMSLCTVWSIMSVVHLICASVDGSTEFASYIREAYEMGKAHSGGGVLAALPAFGAAKLITTAGAIVLFITLVIVFVLLMTRISLRSAGRKVRAHIKEHEAKRKEKHVPKPYKDEPVPEKPKRRSKRADDVRPVPSGSFADDMGVDGRDAADDAYPFETIEIVPTDNITGEAPDVSPVLADECAAEAAHGRHAADAPSEDASVPTEDIAAMQPPAEVAEYQRPPMTLLRMPERSEAIAGESPYEKGKLLIETLASFNISAKLTNISVGPAITRFELQPAQGVRVNRITTLSNDIALALAAPRVRIEAPIPGKAAVGIEIPNKATAMVRLREVIDTREFETSKSPLTFALGKDIAGKPVMADLEKMPHMLIAGATGSGKSVCINGVIVSLAYKSSPADVRMILIDPKVVELSVFSSLPHLFCPIVTDPKKAAGALKWAVMEMEQRYAKMGRVGARDLARYNALQEKDEDRWPRLVIIIDELADLMMVASKDVEESICRIAQLGRACGIHLIVATQRPSVDVITGLIKANIPSRVAFAVANAVDSRVILDTSGAEKLLGRGDMLFHANGAEKPIRAQGAFVSDDEVEAVMKFFADNKIATAYDETVISDIATLNAPQAQGNGKQEDEFLPDAVRVVLECGNASISMIQRRLRVGYARAARLVDIMEQKKIVSGFDGSKPRKVLIDYADYERMFGSGAESTAEGEE